MGALDGRVAIVTGAATSGIGREHALLLAREGARVVLNQPLDPAVPEIPELVRAVVEQVRAKGGAAVGSTDDVASWEGGRQVVQLALDAFGALDVLVNNWGGWRDNRLVDMEEREWDEVMRIHLRGHFVPLRWAARHWRDRNRMGDEPRASVVNTSSPSGLFGRPGQANYGAAKAGIAALTVIAAHELARYGVRVNAIAPAARTSPNSDEPAETPLGFDAWDPANISPLVAYLATGACPATGKTFFVHGGTVELLTPWRRSVGVHRGSRWTVADLEREMGPLTSILDPG